MRRSSKKKFNAGQAATELAVFGAIIIFLLGAIIRAALSNSYSQNENLKAMRYALLQSYESSKNLSTSRNNATVVYLEDRLSADFGKYGSLERTPYIATGSGTFTNLLYYPIDASDLENSLPVMDLFINGVHLPLTTAAISKKTTALNPPSGYVRYYTKDAVPDPASNGSYHYKSWDFKCLPAVADVDRDNSGGIIGAILTGANTTIFDAATESSQIVGYYGCPMFYTIVVNGTPDFCSVEPCSGPLTTLNERFDLNRNDNFNDDPKDGTLTQIPRLSMSWQWSAIDATSTNVQVNGNNASVNINTTDGAYPSYDVDGDRKEETIYDVGYDTSAKGPNAVNYVQVIDYQDGDIDLTHDNTSLDQSRTGLLGDSAIYTLPRDLPAGSPDRGTYLEIREGNLVRPGNNTVVRSVNHRDTVDLVERKVRLSNDTQRFCLNGVPQACIGGVNCSVDSDPNPVEACGDCLGDNITKTCFDPNSKIIYIRSRLGNSAGHKWLTNTSGSDGKWGELKIR